MPDVSVVVPTLGRDRLLRLALRSALYQRDVDLEIIVVDDGPADGVVREVDELADARVRVVRHDRRRGQSAARNTGIARARGRWVAFLDDDDLWAPDKLAGQLAALHATGRDWAYPGAVAIDLSHRVLGVEPPITPAEVMAGLPRRNVVPAGASSVVVRRATLARVGAFEVGLRHIEDWDLFLRLSRHGPPAWVPEPLVAVRIHPDEVSLDLAGLGAALDWFEQRYGLRVDRAAIHRGAAWACLAAGRPRDAVSSYLRVVAVGDLTSLARTFVALLPAAAREAVVRRRLVPAAEEAAERAAAQAWVDEVVGA